MPEDSFFALERANIDSALVFPYERTFRNIFVCEESSTKLGLAYAVFDMESCSCVLIGLWILCWYAFAASSSLYFEVAHVRVVLLADLHDPVGPHVQSVVIKHFFTLFDVSFRVAAILVFLAWPAYLTSRCSRMVPQLAIIFDPIVPTVRMVSIVQPHSSGIIRWQSLQKSSRLLLALEGHNIFVTLVFPDNAALGNIGLDKYPGSKL